MAERVRRQNKAEQKAADAGAWTALLVIVLPPMIYAIVEWWRYWL